VSKSYVRYDPGNGWTVTTGSLSTTFWREEAAATQVGLLQQEIERLRDAVAYLRGHIQTPTPDRPAWCWPSVWQEFERRVSQ
jgi:hypothetical protein